MVGLAVDRHGGRLGEAVDVGAVALGGAEDDGVAGAHLFGDFTRNEHSWLFSSTTVTVSRWRRVSMSKHGRSHRCPMDSVTPTLIFETPGMACEGE